MSERDVVEMYVNSLSEHASHDDRLKDLRNEDSQGKQRTSGRSRGEALTAFDKEDFRQHVRQTLSDPNTKYIIDTSNDRMVFYNGSESNNARITFTPAQFTEGDGHAGTLMRDAFKDGARKFESEIDDIAEKNINGIAPEVRSVSDGGWIDHLEKYRVQLENVPDRVLAKGDLRTDYARANDAVKTEPLLPLDYNAPNAPKIAAEVTEELAEKSPSMLRGAFEAAAPALKIGGKIASVIPIVGTIIGVGVNTAEAAELETKLNTAIKNGDISENALLEYNTILAGHIAQGGDPTVILGEAGVQKAFSDWADRNNVQGDLRTSLQPQSLALMAKSGAEVVADAAIDVGQFGAQKTVEGVNYVASSALSSADHAYDYMSGNTAHMQGIYDALPVLDTAANDDLYDPSHLDTDPIHNYPTAHDMAQIKTQIVNTQDMIEQINNGRKEPFNGMNKTESADFLQERITRLNDRFESTYDAAKADGTLAEVTDYAAQYGAFNADKAAQSLAVRPSEPAANQSWDAPKTRALAM